MRWPIFFIWRESVYKAFGSDHQCLQRVRSLRQVQRGEPERRSLALHDVNRGDDLIVQQVQVDFSLPFCMMPYLILVRDTSLFLLAASYFVRLSLPRTSAEPSASPS